MANVLETLSGGPTAVAFGLASRLRGAKVFHPVGVVHEATVTITGSRAAPASSPLLREKRDLAATVRFSRGAGLPRALPDILGMAIRLQDAHGAGRHQDLLLVTSGDGAVVHHLLLPATGFFALPYSSILPYRAGEETIIVGARPRPARRAADAADEFDEIARVAAAGRPAFDLGVARLGGRMRRVGMLTIGTRLPDSANTIRFNPFNCGPGLEPAGFVNRLRDWAYAGSQRGWQGSPPEALSA